MSANSGPQETEPDVLRNILFLLERIDAKLNKLIIEGSADGNKHREPTSSV